MPVRGRKPKAMTVAPRRSRFDWTEVTDEPYTGAPRLPKTRPGGQEWPEHTRRKWQAWSRMPHAILWQPSDWSFAIDTLELHALWVEHGKAAYASELRYREAILGTTVDSLRGLRITYVQAKPTLTVVPSATHGDDFRGL